jgi:hypothetical protein
MRKIFLFFLVLTLLGIIGYLVMVNKGFDPSDVINTPKTIDLSVDCSDLTNLLVTSTVNVTVSNNSSRTHNNVTIHLIGYDSDGNIIKEKTTTFARTLEPNGSLTKPMTLPAKARSCDCIVKNSEPD